MRINKFLALCGFGSRRKTESLVLNGSVIVNGSVISELSIDIDEKSDTIFVHGKKVSIPSDHLYLMLNKPKGFITTLNDEIGRPTIMDIIPDRFRRRNIFPVGRLDKDTEGLLILTTDGDMANLISSPKSKIEKVYTARLNHPLKERDLKRLSKGVYVKEMEKMSRFESITQISDDKTTWKVVLREGKKRQVRYLFLALGYRVSYLERIAYGPLTLDGTPRGTTRKLKEGEISRLKKAISGNS